MTVKEYLERNNKIEQIEKDNELDINLYTIDLSVLPTNFTFRLIEKRIREVIPNKDDEIVLEMQICRYEPCVTTTIKAKNLDKYLDRNKQ